MNKTSLPYCLAALLMMLSAMAMGADPTAPESPKEHYLVTLIIMVASGASGGIVNYFYRLQTDMVKTKDWPPCIIIGIGASLVVPFLLSLMSSNLVENSVNGKGYITLLSWCLLAGIAGEPFISQMVKRFTDGVPSNNGSKPSA